MKSLKEENTLKTLILLLTILLLSIVLNVPFASAHDSARTTENWFIDRERSIGYYEWKEKIIQNKKLKQQ